MNTCDTCKFWGKEHHAETENRKFCKHRKLDPDVYEGMDFATVYDGIDSLIMTGPKFGCIHHEPK